MNKEIIRLSKISKKFIGPNKDIIILAGEFNATPRSAVYKFLKQK